MRCHTRSPESPLSPMRGRGQTEKMFMLTTDRYRMPHTRAGVTPLPHAGLRADRKDVRNNQGPL
jgi:hypothetical protein